MNARRVLHTPVMGLLMIALTLLAMSGIGLLMSFASWLIHMRLIQERIQVDALDLVNDFHDAVNNGNVDAMLELFAEDATLHDGESTFNSRNEIRDWTLHSPHVAGSHLALISSQVTDRRIVWHDLACSEPEAQCQSHILQWMAVIQKDKIKALSVSLLPMSAGKE